MKPMLKQDVFDSVAAERPKVIYVSGKTCTGKTTFADKLHTSLDYKAVNLDAIVYEAVITPLSIADTQEVFTEVYRNTGKTEWIERFIKSAQLHIQTHLAAGRSVVLEGAVAHPKTLQKLLHPFPKTKIIYFHPENLDVYCRNISSRFMQADEFTEAGLPSKFWRHVPARDFKQFCVDRMITPDLHVAIREYAEASKQESIERLEAFMKVFPDITVVHIS